MNGSSARLEARELECIRGENLLFHHLSFGVASGQVLQIEGANGSGKTSLLRILAGLSPPSDGQVLWRGHDIGHRRAPFVAEMAYLGHQLGLKAELSVGENLRLTGALNGLAEIPGRVQAALREVGLAEQEPLLVRTLSAGQRQRAALARLISSGAMLWILDEPFTALDMAGVALVQRLLEEHAEHGGLAVLTSHQTVDLRGGLSKLVLA